MLLFGHDGKVSSDTVTVPWRKTLMVTFLTGLSHFSNVGAFVSFKVVMWKRQGPAPSLYLSVCRLSEQFFWLHVDAL